jgi:hypothetical protein
MMEITDNLEIRLLVTARKIRMFNESIAQLKAWGSLTNIPESEQMRDELQQEFDWLSEQVRTAVSVA